MGSMLTIAQVMTKKVKMGKSKKGRRSSHHKATGKYSRQRMRTEARRARRWQRHLEMHPNDLLGKENIKNARLRRSGIHREEVI